MFKKIKNLIAIKLTDVAGNELSTMHKLAFMINVLVISPIFDKITPTKYISKIDKLCSGTSCVICCASRGLLTGVLLCLISYIVYLIL